MREVEAQAIRRHQRSRLMHVLTQHLAKRGVQQMCCGVIPLDVATHDRRHAGVDLAERQVAGRLSEQHGAPVDLLHVLDDESPTFARDCTAIGHLTTRLRIERRVAQNQRRAPIVQSADRRHACRHLEHVVAHELQRREHRWLGLPRRQIGQRVRADRQLSAPAILLRLDALDLQRGIEARNVHEIPTLAGHQLRQVDGETVRIVECEDVATTDRAADR